MFLSLWLLLIALGTIYKKSKKIAWMQIALVVLIISASEGIADYLSYVSLFHGLSFRTVFSGNVLFNLSLYVFEFTNRYNVALFFIALFAMIIMYKAILFYTDCISFVLSLYLIAPFAIDAIQIKNFIAMAIWFYFSRYLYMAYIGNKRRHNLFMYLLGVTIASGFHFSFVIMYFFVLCVWLKLNKIVILLACIGAVSTLIFYTNVMEKLIAMMSKSNINILTQIYSKFTDYMANFDQHSMNTRFMMTAALYIGTIIMLWFVYKMKKKGTMSQQTELFDFLLVINVASAIIFPIMTFSKEIYRMQRNLLLLNYSIVSVCVHNKTLQNGKLHMASFFSKILCVGLSICYLYFECIYWNYNSVFAPLFKL